MKNKISLNLLPVEVRSVRVSKLPMWLSFNFFSIPLLFLLLSVVLDIVLGILVLWKDADIKMITNREKTLYPQRQEQRRLEDLYNTYKKLVSDKSDWGRIMNTISDCLPQVGWFYKFDYNLETGLLILKGSFYSKDAGKGLTGEFISCLNTKKVIKDNFSSIKVKQITQRKIGDTEVKDFYIEAKVKKDEKGKKKKKSKRGKKRSKSKKKKKK